VTTAIGQKSARNRLHGNRRRPGNAANHASFRIARRGDRSLFSTPLLDRSGSSDMTASIIYGGLDRTATGTVRNGANQYTIRRSVLQKNPGSMCIIHSNGTKSGDC
jgi:hypothetical protein